MDQSPQPAKPESQPTGTGEQLSPAELPTAPAEPAAVSSAQPSAPLAQPSASQLPSNPATPPVGTPLSGPDAADDQDLIEKEWVDAAEAVIKQTADQPYRQEEAIEDLQVDYLKKRYGREIKKPEQ